MNEILIFNPCRSTRARRAWFVALASASLMAMSCGETPAAWSPFSGWRKHAEPDKKAASETQKATSDTKSTKGFNGSIRKLLNEAKAEEERGNLDRAISLADRATKVSESASKITKTAADCSPAATARYANDLRLKKAELSVSRGRKSSNKATGAALPAEDSKSVVDVAYPDMSPVDTAVADAKQSKPKTVDAGAKKKSSIADLLEDDFEPLSEAPPAVREAAVTRSERSQTNVAIAKKAAPVALPDDSFGDEIFDELLPSNKRDGDHPLRPGQSAKTVDDEVAFFDDDETSTKVAQTSSTTNEDEPANTAVEPAPFKMRPRFDIRETSDLKPTPAKPEVQQAERRNPVITPMDVSPVNQTPWEEQQRLLTLAEKEAAEKDAALSESANEDLLADDLISAFDTEEAPLEEEQVALMNGDLRWSKSLDDEFPADKVRELQHRLDSAAALKPGEIPEFLTSKLIDDLEEAAAKELAPDAEIPIVKLRKHVQRTKNQRTNEERSNEFQTSDPTSVVGGEGARQVIGLTQMVTWQPAKEAARPARSDSIINRMPDDLRQSLRSPATPSVTASDFAVSGSTIPNDSHLVRGTTTTPSSDRSRLRGTLWDNAAAPSQEGYSGSIGASSERKETAAKPTIAPAPPRNEVKQTSFDSARDLFHRDYGDRTESDTGSLTTSANLKVASDGKRTPAGRSPRTDDQSASTRTMLSNGPIERLALLIGVPAKTASALLGAAGLVLLIAGLWTVRAVIRTEKR